MSGNNNPPRLTTLKRFCQAFDSEIMANLAGLQRIRHEITAVDRFAVVTRPNAGVNWPFNVPK